eukprot:130467_1
MNSIPMKLLWDFLSYLGFGGSDKKTEDLDATDMMEYEIINVSNQPVHDVITWKIHEDGMTNFFQKYYSDHVDKMWTLGCYPNGKSTDNNGYVEFLLECNFPKNINVLKIHYTLKCNETGNIKTNDAIFKKTTMQHVVYITQFCETKEIKGFGKWSGSEYLQAWLGGIVTEKKKVYNSLTFECHIDIFNVVTNDDKTMSFKQWKKFDSLRSILEYNNLYNQLCDILISNKLDLDILKNDIEETELNDNLFNEFGIE